MLYYFFITLALALLTFLSYRHHHTAIILLTALLPTYLLRLSIFNLPTNFLELAIVLVALAGLIQPDMRSQWAVASRRLPFKFALLVLLFVLAATISTFISPHPMTSLGILKGWVIVPILLGWLIYSGNIAWQKIINALFISGVAVSLIGLSQIFTLDRIRSIYSVPNSLALFLTPLLVIALWQKRWLVAIPLALALLATQSVSALIAVALTLLAGIFFWTKPLARKRPLVALVLLIFLATAYLSSSGRLTYLTHPPNSISVRLQLWSISWDLVKENPILGIGLGTFEPAYQQKLHERFFTRRLAPRSLGAGGTFSPPLAEFVFRDPHNWVLSFWLNTGLLGLLSFVGLNIWAVHLPRVARWKDPGRGTLSTECDCDRRPGRRPARQDPWQAMMLALLAVLIFGLTDTIYWKNDLATLHWILISLLGYWQLKPISARTAAPK